jgi:hypothetical protein
MTSSTTEVVGGPDWDVGSSSWKAFSTERRKKNVSRDSNAVCIRDSLLEREAVWMKRGIWICGVSYWGS